MGVSSIGSIAGTAASYLNKYASHTGRNELASDAGAGSTSSTAVAKPGVEVTFSEEAKRQLSNGLPAWVNEWSTSLRAKPDQAEAMHVVEQIATVPGGALITVPPNAIGMQGTYYTATGLPVTPESEARFAAISQSIVDQTTGIYQAEKAKGTPAADIFEKIHQFMASQPSDYLQATNWYNGNRG